MPNSMLRYLPILVILLIPSSVSADLVLAEWTEFNGGPLFTATGGTQLESTFRSIVGNANVTDGNDYSITGNNSQWGGVRLEIAFDATAGQLDFTYNVVRTDGSGANQAPDTIQWFYFSQGQSLGLGTLDISEGANDHQVDLSPLPQGPGILLASFSGANGGSGNELAFDNFRISTAIPEPASTLAIGACLIGLFTRRRRVS